MAVQAAAQRAELEVRGNLKTVSMSSADGVVPYGCSYSTVSKCAIFNGNPAGGNGWLPEADSKAAYTLVCIVTGGDAPIEKLDHRGQAGHLPPLLSLSKPDAWYEDCVAWTNHLRAREGLPALARWTEGEADSDRSSAYDASNGAHASMGRRTPEGSGAQNTCPGWGDTIGSIQNCFTRMWNEKTTPGVDSSGSCSTGSWADCGHYFNMRGGDGADYNSYTRVACGFHTYGDGQVWINQNFGYGTGTLYQHGRSQLRVGATQDFACAGAANRQPTQPLVPDCSPAHSLNFDYSDCASDHYTYGCASS